MATKLKHTIDKLGRMTVEVIGIEGEGCVLLTKGLERAYGGVQDRDMKPEAGALESHEETKQQTTL
jgi:hypothetical protein